MSASSLLKKRKLAPGRGRRNLMVEPQALQGINIAPVVRAIARKQAYAAQETKHATVVDKTDQGVHQEDNTISASIGSGTDISDRVGNEIMQTGLEGKIYFNNPATTHRFVRVIIYMVKDTGAFISASGYDAPVDPDSQWVLIDRCLALDGDGGRKVTCMNIRHSFRSGRIPGIKAEYSTTTGSSIRKGEIRMYMTDNSGGTTPATYSGYVRLWYKDG